MTSPQYITEKDFELNNGVKMPALALGTANAPHLADTKESVLAAIKAGYRHIDTAWRYGSEPYIGEALKEAFSKKMVKREDLFITTKIWATMYDKVEESIDESMQKMGIDYVDMVLHHWPVCFPHSKAVRDDGEVGEPAYENGEVVVEKGADWLDTWKQMIQVYQNTNKVRAIGVSNYSINHLKRALKETSVVPVVNQVECHPEFPQIEMRDFCKQHGIKVSAFSPLGCSGAPLIKHPLVKEIASEWEPEHYTINEVLYSYHVLEGRALVARSTNPKRIDQNVKLCPLSLDELEELDQIGIDNPKRYIEPKWAEQVDNLIQ